MFQDSQIRQWEIFIFKVSLSFRHVSVVNVAVPRKLCSNACNRRMQKKNNKGQFISLAVKRMLRQTSQQKGKV